jgi:hypothetical protein
LNQSPFRRDSFDVRHLKRGRRHRAILAAEAGTIFPNRRYFMRLTTLCAAAGIASAVAVTSPAQAFHLIKWSGTGICQVWDDSVPTKPFPSDYRVVSKPVPSFDAALAVKSGLMKRGVCKL